MSLLQVENVGVRFGGLQALQGVDLEVQQGEIFGLLGPNGAGKTTLFNVISGLTPASSGSVSWRGQALLASATTALPVSASRAPSKICACSAA